MRKADTSAHQLFPHSALTHDWHDSLLFFSLITAWFYRNPCPVHTFILSQNLKEHQNGKFTIFSFNKEHSAISLNIYFSINCQLTAISSHS